MEMEIVMCVAAVVAEFLCFIIFYNKLLLMTPSQPLVSWTVLTAYN